MNRIEAAEYARRWYQPGVMLTKADVPVIESLADDALLKAAVKVCQYRYSDVEWADLSEAIGELIDVLIREGVRFDNPRIIHQ